MSPAPSCSSPWAPGAGAAPRPGAGSVGVHGALWCGAGASPASSGSGSGGGSGSAIRSLQRRRDTSARGGTGPIPPCLPRGQLGPKLLASARARMKEQSHSEVTVTEREQVLKPGGSSPSPRTAARVTAARPARPARSPAQRARCPATCHNLTARECTAGRSGLSAAWGRSAAPQSAAPLTLPCHPSRALLLGGHRGLPPQSAPVSRSPGAI